jgi:multisubunit Na+/H+ antiporter MnhG subunit
MPELPDPQYAEDRHEWAQARQYWELPAEPPDLPAPSSDERWLRRATDAAGLATLVLILATIFVPLHILGRQEDALSLLTVRLLVAGATAVGGYFLSRACYRMWQALEHVADKLENERWEQGRAKLQAPEE